MFSLFFNVTSFSYIVVTNLIKHGFKIVIYANHLLRASYPAMLSAAKKILINKRSFELEKEKNFTSIKEIINLIK